MAIECPKCSKGIIRNDDLTCYSCGHVITFENVYWSTAIPSCRPFMNGYLAGGILFSILFILIFIVCILDEFTFGWVIGMLFAAFFGIGFIYGGISELGPAREKYDLFHENPEEYRQVLAQEAYRKLQAKARELTPKDFEANQIACEYKKAVESQQAGEPWRIRYATHPCPHCGHYKVRSANWEDKKLSVAFWGVMSDAIGKSYKCENCRRMW